MATVRKRAAAITHVSPTVREENKPECKPTIVPHAS